MENKNIKNLVEDIQGSNTEKFKPIITPEELKKCYQIIEEVLSDY